MSRLHFMFLLIKIFKIGRRIFDKSFNAAKSITPKKKFFNLNKFILNYLFLGIKFQISTV